MTDFVTCEVFQDADFLRAISIEDKNRKIIQIAGYQGIAISRPIIGNIVLEIYNPEKQAESQLQKLLAEAQVQNFAFVKLITSANWQSLQAYPDLNEAELGTFYLDLRLSKEQLWKQVGDKFRNMVRKAEKNAVYFELSKDEQDLRGWFELYKIMYGKLLPLSYPTIKAVFDLEKSNFMVAKHEGKLVSGAIIFGDRIPFYYAGTTDFAYRNWGVNNFLHWKIIEFYLQKGAFFYDLGGVSNRTEKERNIYQFKKSFNGHFVHQKLHRIFLNGLKAKMLEKYTHLQK